MQASSNENVTRDMACIAGATTLNLHVIKHALQTKRKAFVFLVFEGQIMNVFCPQDNFGVVVSDNYCLPTGNGLVLWTENMQ